MNKSGANKAAVDGINKDLEVPIEVLQIRYLKTILEQDHRTMKRSTTPLIALRSSCDQHDPRLHALPVLSLASRGRALIW